MQLIKKAVDQKKVIIHEYIFPYRDMPAGLNSMLEDTAQGIRILEHEIDFWWEFSGPLGEIPDFLDLIYSMSNKPVLFGNTLHSIKTGALFGMMMSADGSAKEAAKLSKKILQGTDPGRIPVLPSPYFDLGINLTTAIELGIVIPLEMMELAFNNIFR